MPELESWVIDTSPILALIAALGDLRVLQQLYSRVIVPLEVCEEILVESAARLGAEEFEAANWLEKRSKSMTIQPPLSNLLDKGEASVIQLALNEGIQTVCIDEAVGRRIARLSGLRLTGSIGILIKAKQSKAKQSGFSITMVDAIQKMQGRGIRLSETVIAFALRQSNEL